MSLSDKVRSIKNMQGTFSDSNKLLVASANRGKPVNYSIYLIIVYLWMIIVNPQQRFEILGAMHFERILMALSWGAVFLFGKSRLRFTGLTLVIVVFFLWQLMGYYFSPYSSYEASVHWITNYWKLIVFYFLLLISINDFDDMFNIFKGLVIVLFIYQAHSWIDFINGGSYVYQQGIKRIVGVWSGGVGAANAFGMITLFSMPFAFFWYRNAERRSVKAFLVFFIAMSVATIIFSGTRASMVGLICLLFLTFGTSPRRIKVFFLMITAATVIFMLLPESLRYRYTDLIFVEETAETASRSERIAIDSALSRKDGLIDGWNLALKRPVYGYGPGSSALARSEIREIRVDVGQNNSYLQLHNLYGQLMSETGFIGSIIFAAIVILFFAQLSGAGRLKHIAEHERKQLANFTSVLKITMLLWLFYGFFSHTLYRFNWFLLFGCQGALIKIAYEISAAKARRLKTAGI